MVDEVVVVEEEAGRACALFESDDPDVIIRHARTDTPLIASIKCTPGSPSPPINSGPWGLCKGVPDVQAAAVLRRGGWAGGGRT